METTILEDLLFDVKKEALERGHHLILTMRGASMFPALVGGNKIVVAKCDPDRLKQGDIILYSASHEKKVLIAHRLIRKIKNEKGSMLITKGDPGLHCDPAVHPEDVIGRVVRIKKKHFDISLESFSGKVLNGLAFFLSVTRIINALCFLLRKMKLGAACHLRN
jgi:signal peptidase I